MTDQTVSVPLDLLNALRDRYPYAALGPIRGLIELIPSPPKVGDVLTAEQIRKLPDTAVMRDEDGDVLVKVRKTVRRVTMDLDSYDQAEWIETQIDRLVDLYAPIVLVSLPRD